MATRLHTFTADDLMQMPDDGIRRELVAGEIREMAPAGWDHGWIAANIVGELRQHVKTHQLGRVATAEATFRLETDPDTLRAPDVAFVRAERLAQAGRTKGFWRGAPDLAVEIVSPSDREFDMIEKIHDYLDSGTRMVVVVDPDRKTATVYRSRRDKQVLAEHDVLDGGDVVPGWKLPVRDIFA